jgi:hypothetical protein
LRLQGYTGKTKCFGEGRGKEFDMHGFLQTSRFLQTHQYLVHYLAMAECYASNDDCVETNRRTEH